MTRLFISDFDPTNNVTISNANDINYLLKVMRKKILDKIYIFNEKNGEYLTEISEISNKKIILNILNQTKTAKLDRVLRLIFAPIKHPRMHFLIEKATELGVTHLVPIKTKHSVVDKINRDKWFVYVKEAAEQSERLSLPKIESIVDLDIFLKHWDKSKKIIFCNETEDKNTIHNYLKNYVILDEINVLIGPEGGFSKEELKLLETKEFIHSVHLGDNILRAETAAICALACCSNFTF